MRSRGFTRVLVGFAVSSAVAVGVIFAGTAPAAAAPLAPPLSVSVDNDVITFTITNPNPRFSLVNCTPAIVDLRNVPGVISDPSSILTPGVLEYPEVESPLSLFGVTPQQTLTRAVPVLPGIYGVVGACVSIPELAAGLISGNIPIPTISLPHVVIVGGSLGSVGSSASADGNGSLAGSLEGMGFETLNEVIDRLLEIYAGSSEVGSSDNGSTGSLTGSLSNGSSSSTGSNSGSGSESGSVHFDFNTGSGSNAFSLGS